MNVFQLFTGHVRAAVEAVYTVRYATAIYVLHVFQKKSKRGRETPQRDLDLIKERLKRAEALHKSRTMEGQR
jgi:phage-related protein